MRGTCDGLKTCSLVYWPLANPCPFTSFYANASYSCVSEKPGAQIMNPTFETGDEAELKFDYGSKDVTIWGWEANGTWPNSPQLEGLVTLISGTHRSNVEGVDVGNGTKALGGNWLILGNSSRVVPVWQVREGHDRGRRKGGDCRGSEGENEGYHGNVTRCNSPMLLLDRCADCPQSSQRQELHPHLQAWHDLQHHPAQGG